VSSLKELVDLWEPNKGSYNIKFKKDISGSLKNIFTGIAKFAKQEWGGERLKGVESGDQEDEHSCFSDLTKEDFIYDAQGVLNVFTGDFNGKTGAGLDEIISANSLKTNITSARDTFDSTKTGGISGRYDQVILSGDPERSKLTTVKTTIQKISDDTITAGKSLGITISAN
ncbi:MAG: hypothetical protein K8R21_00015, partial [Leptospira sp.]|nr:hypothetical protein [Leptospira sp.]